MNTRDRAPSAFRTFAVMYVLATLFHQAQHRLWLNSPVDAAASLTAVVALARPGSPVAFVAFLLAQSLAIYRRMPLVPNHWLFTFLVSLTYLAAVAWTALRRRGARGRLMDDAFPALAACARWQLLALYFWAVFHKLNTHWFDPAVSCAVYFLGDAARVTPLAATAPYWVLLAEAAIPALLLVPATRAAGAAFGAVFHFGLGVMGYSDFSSMLFALFPLFVPEFRTGVGEVLVSLRRGWRTLSPRARQTAIAAVVAITLVSFAPVIGPVFSALRSTPGWIGALRAGWAPVKTWLETAFYLAWWLYGGACVGLFVSAASRHWRRAGRPVATLAVPEAALLVFPIVVFLNGASPYLGLKTETSFAMFSNLRTEGGRGNHFLVPTSVQIADYQGDLVHFVASSDARLQWFAETDFSYPRFELRAYVAQRSRGNPEPISATIEYAGTVRTVPDLAADPELGTSVPRWLRRYLVFRPADDRPEVRCRH